MRRALPVLTGLALALGAIHLSLSALSWRNWSIEALWFAGSGLAILVAGLLNVAMMRAERTDHLQKTAWLLANLVMTGFFGVAWLVMREPQVIVGGLVFCLLSVSTAGRRVARPASRD